MLFPLAAVPTPNNALWSANSIPTILYQRDGFSFAHHYLLTSGVVNRMGRLSLLLSLLLMISPKCSS